MLHRIRRRGLVLALATGLLTAQVMVAGASPAAATPQECERGANGFVDIPDTLRGTQAPVGPVSIFGRTATLYYGRIGGVTRGWAHLGGDTLWGDSVWMDWTRDGGRTWIQCGPFEVSSGGQTKTSAAQRTSSDANWRFRACLRWGRHEPAAIKCTDWW
ncbi:hypothetical protein ACIBQ1_39215 [Nonomuraea sp. NPDC050153]|uniref:hypothetical protein n=1 Tax=Nonomuraea sp. NPDC050153 TaxID=3364359 RepID=UPI00379BE3C4